ncbi:MULTISPECIES: hypothetical protein [Lactobacillales]|uniref:hypothetical protein n=1 Tax=Lactobacillales TaxID=186826 RepID=UPI0018F2604F|nr:MULTISPECIES: hypothetical protein [Lactobacillales]MBJ7661875.1 hypothetical protein [Weissella confusa]
MIALYFYILFIVGYWGNHIWSKRESFGTNFKNGDEAVTAFFKTISKMYLKNEKLRKSINLIFNAIMKLNLAIVVNTVVYYVVLYMSGNKEDTTWEIVVLGSLLSIVVDYILLIALERDLDKEEHAILKNFIDALMQLSVLITLIAGLINLKTHGSALVTILYVLPALISYKYQLKRFDKEKENKKENEED